MGPLQFFLGGYGPLLLLTASNAVYAITLTDNYHQNFHSDMSLPFIAANQRTSISLPHPIIPFHPHVRNRIHFPDFLKILFAGTESRDMRHRQLISHYCM